MEVHSVSTQSTVLALQRPKEGVFSPPLLASIPGAGDSAHGFTATPMIQTKFVDFLTVLYAPL